jgi:hypothetical protein
LYNIFCSRCNYGNALDAETDPSVPAELRLLRRWMTNLWNDPDQGQRPPGASDDSNNPSTPTSPHHPGGGSGAGGGGGGGSGSGSGGGSSGSPAAAAASNAAKKKFKSVPYRSVSDGWRRTQAARDGHWDPVRDTGIELENVNELDPCIDGACDDCNARARDCPPGHSFLMTSRHDAFPEAIGLDPRSMYKVYGSITEWQCTKPCRTEVFHPPALRRRAAGGRDGGDSGRDHPSPSSEFVTPGNPASSSVDSGSPTSRGTTLPPILPARSRPPRTPERTPGGGGLDGDVRSPATRAGTTTPGQITARDVELVANERRGSHACSTSDEENSRRGGDGAMDGTAPTRAATATGGPAGIPPPALIRSPPRHMSMSVTGEGSEDVALVAQGRGRPKHQQHRRRGKKHISTRRRDPRSDGRGHDADADVVDDDDDNDDADADDGGGDDGAANDFDGNSDAQGSHLSQRQPSTVLSSAVTPGDPAAATTVRGAIRSLPSLDNVVLNDDDNDENGLEMVRMDPLSGVDIVDSSQPRCPWCNAPARPNVRHGPGDERWVSNARGWLDFVRWRVLAENVSRRDPHRLVILEIDVPGKDHNLRSQSEAVLNDMHKFGAFLVRISAENATNPSNPMQTIPINLMGKDALERLDAIIQKRSQQSSSAK